MSRSLWPHETVLQTSATNIKNRKVYLTLQLKHLRRFYWAASACQLRKDQSKTLSDSTHLNVWEVLAYLGHVTVTQVSALSSLYWLRTNWRWHTTHMIFSDLATQITAKPLRSQRSLTYRIYRRLPSLVRLLNGTQAHGTMMFWLTIVKF